MLYLIYSKNDGSKAHINIGYFAFIFVHNGFVRSFRRIFIARAEVYIEKELKLWKNI
jgi:hypothetical protein